LCLDQLITPKNMITSPAKQCYPKQNNTFPIALPPTQINVYATPTHFYQHPDSTYTYLLRIILAKISPKGEIVRFLSCWLHFGKISLSPRCWAVCGNIRNNIKTSWIRAIFSYIYAWYLLKICLENKLMPACAPRHAWF
jgi:hypothetical protein